MSVWGPGGEGVTMCDVDMEALQWLPTKLGHLVKVETEPSGHTSD
jgi:hypothetical protein